GGKGPGGAGRGTRDMGDWAGSNTITARRMRGRESIARTLAVAWRPGGAPVLLRYCSGVGPFRIPSTSLVHGYGLRPRCGSISGGDLKQFFLRKRLISALGLFAHLFDAFGFNFSSLVPP